MIRQAVITPPKQALLIATAAAVGAVAVLQTAPVTPHRTSVASTAVELMSAGSPVDLGSAAMEAAIGQLQLPEAADVASLDPTVFAPLAFDDGGADLPSILGELAPQAVDPAAWVAPIAQGGVVDGLFTIVQDVVQFVWNVITFPIRVVEQLVSDVVGLL